MNNANYHDCHDKSVSFDEGAIVMELTFFGLYLLVLLFSFFVTFVAEMLLLRGILRLVGPRNMGSRQLLLKSQYHPSPLSDGDEFQIEEF